MIFNYIIFKKKKAERFSAHYQYKQVQFGEKWYNT